MFDPNRFTEEERAKRHKGTYLAFGEGPRSKCNFINFAILLFNEPSNIYFIYFSTVCSGIRFALAQTKAGLMSIVRDYKITLSPRHKSFVTDVRAFLYQARDGLMVNFTPRATTK